MKTPLSLATLVSRKNTVTVIGGVSEGVRLVAEVDAPGVAHRALMDLEPHLDPIPGVREFQPPSGTVAAHLRFDHIRRLPEQEQSAVRSPPVQSPPIGSPRTRECAAPRAGSTPARTGRRGAVRPGT